MTNAQADFVDQFKLTQVEVHNTALSKGWWAEPRSFGETIALMHGELSEALEWARNGNPKSDHIPEFSGVEEELADEIIRIMDRAQHDGLRVAEALVAKAEFNKTRPYKHGKKF